MVLKKKWFLASWLSLFSVGATSLTALPIYGQTKLQQEPLSPIGIGPISSQSQVGTSPPNPTVGVQPQNPITGPTQPVPAQPIVPVYPGQPGGQTYPAPPGQTYVVQPAPQASPPTIVIPAPLYSATPTALVPAQPTTVLTAPQPAVTTNLNVPAQPIGYKYRPRWDIFWAGVGISFPAYIAAATGGALVADQCSQDPNSHGTWCQVDNLQLRIPFAGPWLVMRDLPNPGNELAKVGLAANGVVQAGGILMSILGLTIVKKIPIYPSKNIQAQVASTGNGIMLNGSF